MTISFITPGTIDLEAAFTFGMSAKEGEKPIGFFGTGLKYAVATLLRTGHKVTVHVGETEHLFTLQAKEHRGKEFNVVCLDGKPLGFTTELGKLWEVWMAFRELHSNTLDEGGITVEGAEEPSTEKTTIRVDGEALRQAWLDRRNIFCEGKVLDTGILVEVRQGMSNHVYYRGVRAMKLERPACYTYNITGGMSLTEDRTFQYQYLAAIYIAQALVAARSTEVIERILMAPMDSFEHSLRYVEHSNYYSDEFIETVGRLCNDAGSNPAARAIALSRGLIEEADIGMDYVQLQQMDKALVFLKGLGFAIDTYPIKICELNAGIHGLAKNGTIYISPKCFRQGTKYLASTLYEEYLHLSEGVVDESRQMQTILFDTIITMGEKIMGQPL